MVKKQSSLDIEAAKVIRNGKVYKFPKIELIIHTDTDDILLDQVPVLHYTRNFNQNLTDIIMIEFMMGYGTFRDKLFEKKDNLEISITFFKEDHTVVTDRYKLIIISEFKDMNKTKQGQHDEKDLDTQEMLHVKAQAVDPMFLTMKNIYVDGCYHDVKLDTLMKLLYVKGLKNKTVSGKPFTYNINIYKLDNDVKYRNVLIKPFTKLAKLPMVLQNEIYGLYFGGIGTYFTALGNDKERDYDFEIYPLFDYDRYDNENDRPRLYIINPGRDHMDKNEYDLYYDNGVYKMIVNDIDFKDSTSKDRFKEGTGIIKVDSSMNTDYSNMTITDVDITMSSKDLITIERFDTTLTNYDMLVNTLQDDNKYRYYSNLYKTQGVMAIIKLGKVNPEHFYPGMPFKYAFMKDKEVIETTGIIQNVDYIYDLINKTVMVTIGVTVKRIGGK